MNKADLIHKQFIKRILEEGTFDENPRPRYKSDGSPAYSKFITQVFEEYDISKGELPITTLRPISVKSAINEILAIYQTQTNTQDGFERHKVGWWLPWMNEEGNIGRAYSYNLESHRPNEMKREVVKVKRKIVDEKFGEIKPVIVGDKLEPNWENKDDLIGKTLSSNNYGDFVVIDVNGKECLIQFCQTNYTRTATKNNIKTGEVKDIYYRNIYGVGYIGEKNKVKNLKEEHVEILYHKWHDMIKRCYDKKSNNYKSYGGKGVFVHQRWHSFENFLKDVRYLPQYHLAKEVDFKNYEIDKDWYGSNCYSKDTSVFIHKKENMLYSNNSKPFTLISPNGEETLYIDQKRASFEHDLHHSNLNLVLKGKYKQCKGYTAKYINDKDTLYRYELSRNQVNELLRELKENPFGRRHILSFFHWANQDKKMLVECAFMTLWSVRKVKDEYYLDCTLIQRSSDYLVAGFINCIQYVALQMMVAHECGYKVGKFARFTQNLHIYDRHIEQAHELLNRTPSDKQPKLILNAEGKSFYEIEESDFELIDYEPVKPQLKFDLGI